MTRRRWWLVALGVATLGWVLGAEWVSITHGIQENHLLDALGGLAFVGAGIVALDQRPGNVIGPLMIGFGTITYTGNWSNLSLPLFPTLVLMSNSVAGALLVHIILAYPGGTVGRRFDRAVLAMTYALIGGTLLVAVLSFPRPPRSCDCAWTPLFFPDSAVFRAATAVNDHLAFVLAPLALVAVLRRYRAASGAERKALKPLWIATSVLGVTYVASAFGSPTPTDGFSYLMFELRALLQLTVPMVFLWGILSTHLAKGAVSDLVVELESPSGSTGLRSAMARALHDPTLDIAYAMEGDGRWVDPEGRDVASPEPAERRAVTLISNRGKCLAALSHDPALDETLVRACAVAAGMAIANERLGAEVRAQLAEVRASRQRIVEAGDRERRRVERNLHDGAQQRLVTIALALAMIRDRAGLDPTVAKGLEQTAAELTCAIAELRELARGIHPAILSEEGLGAAVEALAARSPLPVSVTSDVSGRLSEGVEATAYYVVSEALTNMAKYAQASNASIDLSRMNGLLRVKVTDDGVGGATLSSGSGLSGLQDRVLAVGGQFQVDSPRGAGTRVVVEIPANE